MQMQHLTIISRTFTCLLCKEIKGKSHKCLWNSFWGNYNWSPKNKSLCINNASSAFFYDFVEGLKLNWNNQNVVNFKKCVSLSLFFQVRTCFRGSDLSLSRIYVLVRGILKKKQSPACQKLLRNYAARDSKSSRFLHDPKILCSTSLNRYSIQ